MAHEVTVRSAGGLTVEALSGANRLLLDADPADGGAGSAFAPHPTLLAALGACTAMTLRLYARHKGWPLEGVEADLAIHAPPAGAPTPSPERITVVLRLFGPLDDAQRTRLLEIARKCPVRKTLAAGVTLEERLA